MPAPRTWPQTSAAIFTSGAAALTLGVYSIWRGSLLLVRPDGLGRMAAQLLIEQGHNVVLHARSQQRGQEALAAVPGADNVVIGDLASIAQTRNVAEQVNRIGSFDAIIHNAGVGYREPRRNPTEDGLPQVFRRQHTCAVYSDRSYSETEAPGLP